MPVHDEHRQRMKKRFLMTGLEGMHDHEVLELLLFYAIPRRDVNPIAHALMEKFGSLSAVFEASVPELKATDGVGENTAILLHMMLELFRKYSVDHENQRLHKTPLNSPKLFREYMSPHFVGFQDEVVAVACLDHKGYVIHYEQLAHGSINSVHFSVRKLVEIAMQHHAQGIILAHNHPRGALRPSNEDISLTSRIYTALRGVEIQLLDHVIVTEDDSISMREQGLIFLSR